MNLFFTPFFFFFFTRLKSTSKFISWIIIYLAPLILSVFIFSSDLVKLQILLLTIVCSHNLYEIGYIQNDTETIKKEYNPTLRLTLAQLSFYEKNKSIVYIVRFLISIFLTVTIVFYYDSLYIYCVWLITPIFFIYNLIRSRLNLLLHFILVFCRYCLPVFISTGSYSLTLLMILCFPLPNLLERASEKRFGFFFYRSLLKDKISSFRVFYYLCMTAFCFVLYFRGSSKEELTIVVMLVFYTFYRSLILFKEKISRSV